MRPLLIVWTILCACVPLRAQQALTPAEAELAAAAGIPAEVALVLRGAGDDLRRLEGVDTVSYDVVPAPGLTIGVAESDALATVRLLSGRVGPEFRVFRSEMHFGHEPDRVALLRNPDPFAPVVAMGTTGVNYGITNGMILDRLRAWHARYGLRIVGASREWVEAELVRQPEDMLAFAREVYEFCPDIVDQGTDTVEALAEELRRTNTLFLWWD
jgi:Domain of unknown function (DUF4253)